MKKMFLRVIALVLTICALQVAFVPSVATAASTEGEYARPVTVLEEALTRWEDDRSCVANVGGDDYLVLPIYGGKMYIYNLDTQELVDEVNTGIQTPRGIVADDEKDIVYLVGDSHYMYIYDLKTNKGSRSTDRFYGGGSTVYDINFGDDGKLYFGSNKNRIIQYDPNTETFTNIATGIGSDGAGYFVSSVIKKGNYIYAAVSTGSDHWLVKLDVTQNNKRVARVSFKDTGPSTYLTHMSMTEEGIIFGGTTTSLMAFDTTKMEQLTEKDFGLGNSTVPIYGYISEKICTPDYPQGRYYFTDWKGHDLYAYDWQTKKIEPWKDTYVQMLCCQGKTVTLNRDGAEGEYLIAYTDVQAAGITYINVQTGQQLSDTGLFAGKGASSKVNALTSGSNGELYYGGFLSNLVATYNTTTGVVTNKTATSSEQTDAICVNGNYLYAGNYAHGNLTRMNLNTHKTEILVTLNNTLFDQARIHSIVAGDNKIFLGTFPDVRKYGGVLAWYDYDEELTYVVVGPAASDVYCGKTFDSATGTSIAVEDVEWYQNGDEAKTPVTTLTMTGVVENQGIKDVAYHNGILYAATSTYGGTETAAQEGVSPVIIAYNVANKEVIATYDFADKGFAADMFAVGGIEVDANGTLWGVAAETLFTLTLNQNNTFTYKDHLVISKTNFDGSQTRENSSILFKDGYVYVAFEKNGGICKVSMTDSSDYTNLLPDVTDNGQVPNSMAFGGDGNLYYLLASSLKMVAITPQNADWTKAVEVTNTIASANTLDKISEARQAYEQLTLTQKSLVQNYAVLEQAEVDALNAGIAELGVITWADYAQVQALLSAYKQMPRTQQSKVTDSYILIQANKKLQEMQRSAPVIEEGTSGTAYYETLEDAAATVTEGTIRLRDNVEAGTVNLKPNVVLDLDGYTLTVNGAIDAAVMDSQDGKGLIVSKSARLTSNVDQLILWDGGASGYRLFNYSFTNRDIDANKKDSEESAKIGKTLKSFWSALSFVNRDAYALIATSDLQIGFEVSWTPEGGTATSKTFMIPSGTVNSWAETEQSNTEEKNYWFWIQLQGFENLTTNGLVEVKPVVTTKHNTIKLDATQYTHKLAKPMDILQFEEGHGEVPSTLSANN